MNSKIEKGGKMEPRFYQAMHFEEPVRFPQVCGGPPPAHADMLRYDLGFHDPADPSVVAFPIFQSRRYGRTTKIVTHARWRSFGMRLNDMRKGHEKAVGGDWITYRPGAEDCGLQATTLDDYCAREQVRIVGWR